MPKTKLDNLVDPNNPLNGLTEKPIPAALDQILISDSEDLGKLKHAPRSAFAGGTAAALIDMSIEGVVTGVQPAAHEPSVKRGPRVVPDLIPAPVVYCSAKSNSARVTPIRL